MKYIKAISWYLGISMFMVGFLKFFNPFKEWYSIQISASELGQAAYVLGIAGEIGVGLTLMFALLARQRLPAVLFSFLISGASAATVVMMATGIYVHAHPAVPAEVLPMKIKPPYIPGFFLALAALNGILAWRFRKVSTVRSV